MPPVLTHRNNQLYVDLGPLLEAGLEETYLTADVAAAGVALTVKDIDGFAISHYLIIGELGEESCELVKVHASTAPSGTTITLVAGGVEFAHSAGTRVRRVEWNQIEFSHAATLAGNKSTLATVDIQADQLVQAYTDTTQNSGFYFSRFKDATGSTYSEYTDGVPHGGADHDTVGYMIERALRENDTRITEELSREDCYAYLNEGMRFVRGKQLHSPTGLVANHVAGQTSRGVNVITLPVDIYDGTTNQSVKAVRIGAKTLRYLDPEEFAEQMSQVAVTQVRTQAVATDTELDIDNSYDFMDEGTVSVYINGTQHQLSYESVTLSATAGELLSIPASGDGAITVTIPVDTYVWQNEEEGTPEYFTIRNGNLELWPLPDASYDNKNVEMDYWTLANIVNSDGDTIDEQRFEMLLDYLTWRIRMKVKNNGKLDLSDGFYLMFKEKLNDAIRTSRPNFTHKMGPKLNRINYHR